MRELRPQAAGRARRLRRESTDAEGILWRALRSRQLAGCKFRRQQPIGPFIVDFACLEKRLIVELDGRQHDDQRAEDAARSAWLAKAGFRVLRLWNNEFLENQRGVLATILAELGVDADAD